MNKAFFILFLFLFQFNLKSQNLVPNPSFESYSQCPYSENQVTYCDGWQICFGTPDYFNSCFTIGPVNVGVPNNSLGYQFPYHGDSYCGFGYDLDIGLGSRESLSAQLITPLVIGKKYWVRFRVSLAESQSIGFASNKIGAYFTVGATPTSIPNFAHVYTENIITDTENWVLLVGCFIADTTYDYINLGVFFENQYVDSVQISNDQIGYYYIDFVEVYEDTLSLSCSSVIDTTYDIEPKVVIPNIFSPNQDGKNEVFKIENANGKTEMKIINRWGELVYFAEGRNCYWDGRTYAGVECPESVYYYSIIIEEKEFKGFVHLVR